MTDLMKKLEGMKDEAQARLDQIEAQIKELQIERKQLKKILSAVNPKAAGTRQRRKKSE